MRDETSFSMYELCRCFQIQYFKRFFLNLDIPSNLFEKRFYKIN